MLKQRAALYMKVISVIQFVEIKAKESELEIASNHLQLLL